MNENQNVVVVNSNVSAEELESFRAALESALVAYVKGQGYPDILLPKMEVSVGKKYARVIRRDASSGSAYCFIDLSNGDILKPASWSAPAKHARGNVRRGDASNWWSGALGPYGVMYLR